MSTPDPRPRPKHAAGDGEVPSLWSSLPRRRLAVALAATFVAVPLVVADNLPSQQATEAHAEELVATAPVAAPVAVDLSPTATATVEPTTTTAAPAAETTTTSAAPETTTTTAPRPTTTTTAPPATTTTTTTAAPAPAPAPASSQSGEATWYRYRDGECAHRTLPRGTVVTVRNVANGATATCVVTDRGPYGGNRIIDLDDGTFAQLAPLSAGVIDVVITW